MLSGATGASGAKNENELVRPQTVSVDVSSDVVTSTHVPAGRT